MRVVDLKQPSFAILQSLLLLEGMVHSSSFSNSLGIGTQITREIASINESEWLAFAHGTSRTRRNYTSLIPSSPNISSTRQQREQVLSRAGYNDTIWKALLRLAAHCLGFSTRRDRNVAASITCRLLRACPTVPNIASALPARPPISSPTLPRAF